MASARLEVLLDEAEAEFADAGFEHGSLRKIMREAGADPGAVHYHFGGREALAAAVLDRLLAPLNARRLELLDGAVATGRPDVSVLVEALVRPDVEAAHALQARSPGRARLIGAIYTRPSDFVAAAVSRHFAPAAEAFRPHLEIALPHLGFEEIAWRIRWCVFGPVGGLLVEAATVDHDPAELLERLVRPLAAALAA